MFRQSAMHRSTSLAAVTQAAGTVDVGLIGHQDDDGRLRAVSRCLENARVDGGGPSQARKADRFGASSAKLTSKQRPTTARPVLKFGPSREGTRLQRQRPDVR
jgi:hypothetical protein